MKKFLFLLISVSILSCGGSDDDGTSQRSREDDAPQTENMMTQGNCVAPNLKMDVSLNQKFCGSEDCLIQWKGYWWWTNYQFTGKPNYFSNQGQAWNPGNCSVDGEGLHLKIRKHDMGAGSVWTAAEVCAIYKSDKKTLAKLGYGTYLVSARIKTAASWNQLDRNVAFGLFTYQRDAGPNSNNPYRELDLAEISRWGTPPCKNVSDQRLCIGNAQFAVQKWERLQENVQRYTIDEGVKDVTLVMYWKGAKQAVIFKQFNGMYTLENLPAQPSHTYTTSSAQDPYIPDDGCVLFHMNLWMGNYGETDGNGIHPGPSNGQDQEVVVTNFQYKQ